MAKQRRKRKATRRRKSAKSGGRFGAMLFGLFAGLAIAGAVWYSTLPATDRGVSRAATTDGTAKPETQPAAEPAAKPVPLEADGTGYDFYDMLPAQEVVVSDDFAARRRASEQAPATPASPLTQQGAYLIQAGSFRSPQDADRMKARISLLGMQPRVESVEINDRVFHRVRIGPVEDLERLNSFRTRLRGERIDIQVIRVDD